MKFTFGGVIIILEREETWIVCSNDPAVIFCGLQEKLILSFLDSDPFPLSNFMEGLVSDMKNNLVDGFLVRGYVIP